MRLTLRTLLAYLDDRLPPNNAKEIGQKIAKSPFATELADRIRDVVRRRRLATTDESVRMVDANLVAEYLDDQLTPELVARIEQEILKSDVSLAEVAAAHEIIGLLREPVALDSRIRDRLYSLDPSGKLEVVKALSANASSQTQPTPNPAPSDQPEWKPLEVRTTKSYRVPVIGMALLLLVWLGVIFTDPNLSSTPQVAENSDQNFPEDGGAKVGDAQSVPVDQLAANNISDVAAFTNQDAIPGTGPVINDVRNQTVDSGNTPPGQATSTVTETSNATMANSDSVGAAAPGAAGAPAAAGALAANTSGVTDPPSAGSPGVVPDKSNAADQQPMALSAANGLTPRDTSSTGPAVPSAEIQPPQSLSPPQDGRIFNGTQATANSVHPLYVSDNFGMLLARPSANKEWRRATQLASHPRTIDQLRLHDWREEFATATLATPGDFDAVLSFENAGWQVEMLGDSVMKIINGNQTGIKPVQGRFVIARTAATDIPDDARVDVLLEFGAGRLILTLNTIDTKIALDVVPARATTMAPGLTEPNGSDQKIGAPEIDDQGLGGQTDVVRGSADPYATDLLPWKEDFAIEAIVVEGAARITDLKTQSTMDLARTQAASWRSLNTGNVANPSHGDAIARASLLAWTSKLGSEPIEELQKLRTSISLEFAAAESLAGAAMKLYSDRNAEIGAMAIRVISVTRDVDSLTTVLLQSGEELVRRTAIDGLQRIATQTQNGSDSVRTALENRLPMNEVAVMFQLIVGLNDEETRSPAVSADLLLLLSSDRLATRELAFYRMEQLVGDRFSYHADSDPGRRLEAIKRWQRYIDRNEGQLLP